MADTRRGRISQATYLRVVSTMLTRDWFTLDECDTLTQLEAVGHLVATYPMRFYTEGVAVRFLLDKAIQQVVAACRASSDQGSQRIADFLELRVQGKSVSAIARAWGLSREHVSRTFAHKAIRLVTGRVLALGRHKLTLANERQAAPAQPAGPQRIA